MTTEHEPNEYGFSGGATAPEPEIKPVEKVDGESLAVPRSDITAAMTDAIEEATEGHDDRDSHRSRR